MVSFKQVLWGQVKYCSKRPKITIISDSKQDSYGQGLLIFQHSKKLYLLNLQNHKLPTKLLRVFYWQNFFNQCENFMKIPLQSRPKFFGENLNRLFTHEVTYERKLIRHWNGISLENVIHIWASIVFVVREKSIFEKWTSNIIYWKSQKTCVSMEIWEEISYFYFR